MLCEHEKGRNLRMVKIQGAEWKEHVRKGLKLMMAVRHM